MENIKTLYKISNTNKVQVWRGWTEGNKVVVEHGNLDGKQRTDSYEAIGKNIGKSNETAPEQQALLELEAKYVDKVDNKHYRYSIEEAKVVKEDCTQPMHLVNYKDHSHKVKFPCYVQPKCNGSRVTFKNFKTYNKKGREEECKVQSMYNYIHRLNLNFDAEVYCHGMSLQDIRSAWTKPNENSDKLKFYVFDVPEKNEPFKERVEMLLDILDLTTLLGGDKIVVLTPTVVHSQEALDTYYEKQLKEGYEGIIIRNVDGIYEFGKRSNDVFKRKPRYDTEAKVFEVTKDKKGEGVLKARLSDAFNNVEVKGKMKGTHEERLYENQLQYLDQWVTLSYEELSNKGIPTKPVFHEPRKCDDKGEPLE